MESVVLRRAAVDQDDLRVMANQLPNVLDVRLPGTNANEDGTVTNHGIVNPDYTQNVEHLWWAASLLRAGGVPVPEALFVNADLPAQSFGEVLSLAPLGGINLLGNPWNYEGPMLHIAYLFQVIAQCSPY